MKRRKGFVSNSSSSSFVIKKDDLTALQVELIKRHGIVGEWLGIEYPDCAWQITESATQIEGYTSMTNFRMSEFFDAIGVNAEDAEWWHS